MIASKEVSVETVGKALILRREFEAPRELVFEAFSECEHIRHWWGPKGWSVTHCEMDFRPGGRWHYCFASDETGQESWGLALYDAIEEPGRIEYRDHFADKDGTPNPEMPVQKITMVLTEEDGITTLTSTTDYSREEDLQQILEMGVVEGVSSTWERLDELLANLQA